MNDIRLAADNLIRRGGRLFFLVSKDCVKSPAGESNVVFLI